MKKNNIINLLNCCIRLRRVHSNLNGIDVLVEYLIKKLNGEPYEDELFEYWEGFVGITLEELYQNMIEENITIKEFTQLVIKYKVIETINMSQSSVGIIDRLFDEEFSNVRAAQSYFPASEGEEEKEFVEMHLGVRDVVYTALEIEPEEDYDDKDYYETDEFSKGKKSKETDIIDQLF